MYTAQATSTSSLLQFSFQRLYAGSQRVDMSSCAVRKHQIELFLEEEETVDEAIQVQCIH